MNKEGNPNQLSWAVPVGDGSNTAARKEGGNTVADLFNLHQVQGPDPDGSEPLPSPQDQEHKATEPEEASGLPAIP